jgi:hypothetical protein
MNPGDGRVLKTPFSSLGWAKPVKRPGNISTPKRSGVSGIDYGTFSEETSEVKSFSMVIPSFAFQILSISVLSTDLAEKFYPAWKGWPLHGRGLPFWFGGIITGSKSNEHFSRSRYGSHSIQPGRTTTIEEVRRWLNSLKIPPLLDRR